MHKRYSALALCCAAVALAGCGSSSSSSTTGTGTSVPAVSAAAFSAKLNTLCKQGNAASKKVASNPAKLIAVVKGYLPKFRALTPSSSQRATYSKFLANVQTEVNDLQAGNLQAAHQAEAKNRAFAAQLHAPACA